MHAAVYRKYLFFVSIENNSQLVPALFYVLIYERLYKIDHIDWCLYPLLIQKINKITDRTRLRVTIFVLSHALLDIFSISQCFDFLPVL